jgi:hypothetical protein
MALDVSYPLIETIDFRAINDIIVNSEYRVVFKSSKRAHNPTAPSS